MKDALIAGEFHVNSRILVDWFNDDLTLPDILRVHFLSIVFKTLNRLTFLAHLNEQQTIEQFRIDVFFDKTTFNGITFVDIFKKSEPEQ